MSKPVRMEREAEEELGGAVEWYEGCLRGLGVMFLAVVDEVMSEIGESPNAGLLVPGVAEGLGVRRRIVRGFPYSICYVEMLSEVRIIAVAHGRRKPGYWRDRLG